MNRRSILDEAIKCVCSDRNQQYGEPEDNFQVIATFWNVYDDYKFESTNKGYDTAQDVAIKMALFKIGRMITSKDQKEDTYIDACGYLACAGQIATEAKNAD